MKDFFKKFAWWSGVALFLILALFILPGVLYHYATVKTQAYCIEDKERINTASGSASKYLIYTDIEVLEDTDTWYYLKFDSSDVYNDLKVGNCYNLKVYGWRVPLFSWYKNIVSIQEELPQHIPQTQS